MKNTQPLKKFKKNKGVVLIETAIGAIIISTFLAQHFHFQTEQTNIRTAKNVGEHIKRIGEAADRFVNDNYSELSAMALGIDTVSSSDAVNIVLGEKPESCTPANATCTITVSGLSKAGYLKNNTEFYSNPVNLGYAIQVAVRKQDGSALSSEEILAIKKMRLAAAGKLTRVKKNEDGTDATDASGNVITETVTGALTADEAKHLVTPVINGIVVTSEPWLNGRNEINYSWLGEAVNQAGVDAGAVGFSKGTFNQTGMYGYKSNWYLDHNQLPLLAEYENKGGTLGYRFGFHSNSNTDFLRRDGTLPMTGGLQMDGNPIYLNYGDNPLSIQAGDDNRIHMSGPVTINNPFNAGTEAEVPEALETEGWLCATNENKKKICMGGEKPSDKNGGNFEIRMWDDRPVLIHNTHSKKGADGVTTMDNGKDYVVMRVGGSFAVHDNLYVGDKTNNGDDIYGRNAGGGQVDNKAIAEATGKTGGNVVSNYNISRGGVILNKDGNVADATKNINGHGKARYENTAVATEFTPEGTIITNDLYIKVPGKSASNTEIKTDNGDGLHISQVIPSYSSRGAFIVQDEDIVQKPNCSWTSPSGDKVGRQGVPRIILSWGNIQTSGDAVDQTTSADLTSTLNINDPQSLKRYLLEAAYTKHRVILKAEELNAATNAWRMIVKTRNFDGTGWTSAGQAVAHVYCQLY